MYQQATPVNWNVPYTGGYCQRYAENTVGLSGVFATALAAWNANMGNHPNEQPPKGIMCALYFSLSKVPAGHVVIWLGDGRVASSSQAGYHESPAIHPSLKHLIDAYTNQANGVCVYLGWTEYIGRKQVVRKGEDVALIQNTDNWYARFNRLHHQLVRNADLSRPVFDSIVGQDAWKVVESWSDHPEAQKLIHLQEVGEIADRDNWPGQIYAGLDKIKELQQAGVGVDQAKYKAAMKELDEAVTAFKKLEK